MAQLKLSKKSSAAGIVCSVATIIAIVLNAGNVRTNERGLELIGNAESCFRDPYVCPAGVLTDGMGNTHDIKLGTIKNDQQIAAEWEKNILEAESCVNHYGNGRKLSDDTFSAAVSVTFRAGCGNMRGSTMFSLFRKGDLKAACNQFPRWVYGGGRVLPGLVTRAKKEEALCLDGL
ncbi:TPA_asm: lysozyme [Salmonella enterica subsp. salamae serovar 60:g,m,t:z6]|uniref:Lysozyme n=1 Tax=Salmonella enterica subsp. houtenae serovar 1,40:z4,z32:- TaxID=1967604 RepID=A0A730W765_SALHO|nr:lysozyme [Salmonella enterica]EBU7696965.1 lysozyme [Salmonella enterica subsp. enterica serovar Oslo]ECC3803716.1 lysozyme [Salmonella enterica subsp. enterica]ECG0940932.1 lysozyme [Salmonella enterica subsp. salamae]ECT8083020.1 lysozyme [Salmonella enterica subsp. enterica serovar Carrau]EGK6861311.1 lysozyme [Salmonella enterica subsp. enterica serovar Glostrup]HAC6697756.1 lysozyme [Salmonella bongori serovar 66:z65:-]HAE2266292.1 lysozyme [Salmonella enterica subsp. enterica serova